MLINGSAVNRTAVHASSATAVLYALALAAVSSALAWGHRLPQRCLSLASTAAAASTVTALLRRNPFATSGTVMVAAGRISVQSLLLVAVSFVLPSGAWLPSLVGMAGGVGVSVRAMAVSVSRWLSAMPLPAMRRELGVRYAAAVTGSASQVAARRLLLGLSAVAGAAAVAVRQTWLIRWSASLGRTALRRTVVISQLIAAMASAFRVVFLRQTFSALAPAVRLVFGQTITLAPRATLSVSAVWRVRRISLRPVSAFAWATAVRWTIQSSTLARALFLSLYITVAAPRDRLVRGEVRPRQISGGDRRDSVMRVTGG
jgi:hypothetical protein